MDAFSSQSLPQTHNDNFREIPITKQSKEVKNINQPMSNSSNTSSISCREEIESLHTFFVQWFKAEIPKAKEPYEPFMLSLSKSPAFVLVSPKGTRTERDTLIDDLYHLHGCRKDDESFSIWIENVSENSLGNGLWLAEYEEHQTVNGSNTKRLSTAIFREKDDGNKLEWVRVHETWISE